MQRFRVPFLCLLLLMAASCSLSADEKKPSPLPPSSPLSPLPSLSPTAANTVEPAFPTVESSAGPYMEQTAVLDGVCFDFLARLNGQAWVWSTPEQLAAFYDQVDASEVCSRPAARVSLDFSQMVLAGVVNSATGCDAAHRFVTLNQDDTTHTQTLILEFTILPGCDYELVQPFVIQLTRPPDGYILQVALSEP